LKVPGFGEVYCYADNGGKGFSKPDKIEFFVEAAATRLRRVREAFERQENNFRLILQKDWGVAKS
jgi:hypothetical protein